MLRIEKKALSNKKQKNEEITMTSKIMQSDKLSLLDQSCPAYGHERGKRETYKKIIHARYARYFQIVETLDVTPEEFWSAVYYVGEFGCQR